MTHSENAANSRKFLFDMNIFDAPAPEEEEADEENLPQLFTEDQLELARQEAHARGRAEAHAEAQASHDRMVATAMESLARVLPALQTAERARESVYERESIALALAAVRKVFPVFAARHGLGEVEAVLKDVLGGQAGQAEILITVSSQTSESILEYIKTIPCGTEPLRCQVQGDPDLGHGDCKIRWRDGGAVRDAGALAESIVARIEGTLAAAPASVHNDPATTPKDIKT